MDLASFFTRLNKLNGSEVQVRIDTVVFDATLVRSEQLGSSGHAQLKIIFQVTTLDVDDYTALRALTGDAVPVKIGTLGEELVLDVVSILHTDARYETELAKPFELCFSEQEVAEEPEEAKAASIVADLRQAGFGTLANQVQHIQDQVSQKHHKAFVAAIDTLRSNQRYALAERLDNVRSALYDEKAETNRFNLLKDLAKTLVQSYVPGAQPDDEMLASIARAVKPLLDPLAIPMGYREDIKQQANFFEPDEVDEEEEKEAIGPGFESPYVKAPMTYNIDPWAPTPSKQY